MSNKITIQAIEKTTEIIDEVSIDYHKISLFIEYITGRSLPVIIDEVESVEPEILFWNPIIYWQGGEDVEGMNKHIKEYVTNYINEYETNLLPVLQEKIETKLEQAIGTEFTL